MGSEQSLSTVTGENQTIQMEESPDPVMDELLALEGALFAAAEMFRSRRLLLAKVKAKNRAAAGSMSAASAVGAGDSVHPQETVALSHLWQLVDGELQEIKVRIRDEFSQILNYNYNMDLSPLLRSEVGNVIRSFQAISAETFRPAVDAFTERGERQNFNLFLHVGANIDGKVWGKTPLIHAIEKRNMRAVVSLVKAGANPNTAGGVGGLRALHIACLRREEKITRFLVLHGADLNLPENGGEQALHLATRGASLRFLDFLISRGADLNAQTIRGEGAVHIAIRLGREIAGLHLVRKGANVNLTETNRGRTPLFHCIEVLLRMQRGLPAAPDNRVMATGLLSHGADVNARDENGQRPLHTAALVGAVEMAEFLLNNGADLHATSNARSNDGRTALHYSATRVGWARNPATYRGIEKRDVARLLVNRGIDVDAVTNDGDIALNFAEDDFDGDSPIRVCLFDLSVQALAPPMPALAPPMPVLAPPMLQ